MRILAAGNELKRVHAHGTDPRDARVRVRGFTLLELMIVVAIMALATAGVSLALRDSTQAQLERDAQRLVALLEAARAQSRASGVAVRWHATPAGFWFEGLSTPSPARAWLGANTQVTLGDTLVLGPEPIIAPQSVVLFHFTQPGHRLRIATDGLRPFTVMPDPGMTP